jgi:hypothetical protein
MNSKTVGLVPIGMLFLVGTFAGMAIALDDPKAEKTADQRFEALLETAMKAPEKADWKALREAFSKTTHYHPYSLDVTEKLGKIAQAIGRGEIKSSEADLLKLVERERFMRLDTLAMLIMLYQKTGQPQEAEKYKKLVDGMLKVLDYPKAGTSFENPIPVLFIDEEYMVTTNMPVEAQSLIVKQGHRFDVLELKAEGDKPGKRIYFDIDLISNAKSILSK